MRPDATAPFLTRRAALGLGAAFVVVSVSQTGLSTPAQAQAAQHIEIMTPDLAHQAALAGDIILIDIRRPEEWLQTGVAEGAIGLDMTSASFVNDLVALRQANPDTPLAVICRTGNRTGYVTSQLAAQGFPGLVDVKEGMVGGRHGDGWLKRGLPTYEGTPENVGKRTRAALP
ncbi:MAG: rhodanese-like domain-containing protein [Pelagimonas sp.]|jgi:rhodanese-related sulfurtransferase|nr:rhodanese-like domain-containing protein [Pelagimonas sp.]